MIARRDRIDLIGGSVLVTFSALLGLNQALVKLVNAGFAPVFQSGLRSACALVPIALYALWRRRRSTSAMRSRCLSVASPIFPKAPGLGGCLVLVSWS